MAIYHISGEGDALSILYNAAADSTIYVDPGIYSPADFKNRGISVIATGGIDETIIDAHGERCCISSGNIASGHENVIHGFTLRNGYGHYSLYTDASFNGGATIRFVPEYCNIYDCSCIVSGGSGAVVECGNLVLSKNPHHLEISGCVFNKSLVYINVSGSYNGPSYSTIHHNIQKHIYSSSVGDWSAFTFLSCCVVSANTFKKVLCNGGCFDSLILSNDGGSTGWILERGCYSNNIIYGNTNFLWFHYAYGGRNKDMNNVFAKNSITRTILYQLAGNGASVDNYVILNNYMDVPVNNTNLAQTYNYALISGNIYNVTDFGFVDEEHNDFRLRPDSILLSAGSYWQKSWFATNNIFANTQFQMSRRRDLEGRRWQDPPSVGPYQYYKEIEGEIPNYINPVGQKERALWSEIEYVQTLKNKTATIDTGIIPNGADTSFEVKFNNMNSAREGNQLRSFVDQTISGTRSRFGFNSNRTADQIGIFTGRTTNGITTASGNGSNYSAFYNKDYTFGPYIGKYDCDLSSITCTAIGSNSTNTMQVTNAECQPFTAKWQLFRNIDSDVGPELRFYYLKIWKSGVLVRHFVPFRVGNVGYLFDKVTKKLFKNQGTGAFILGPDKN